MSINRIYWIDYAKFIGIFLVVFGHTSIEDCVVDSIYSFHMPLFFFISGYLFSFEKYANYKTFAIHRFKQLIIPYLAFNVITYIFWLLIGRKYGADALIEISLFKPLIGIIYGNGNDHFLIHNVVLWFLPCLFVVESLFLLLFKNKNLHQASIILLGLIVSGYIYTNYVKINLPWGIETAIVALVFYGFSNVFKEGLRKILSLPKFLLISLSVLSLVAFFFTSTQNGRINMLGSDYNNYFLFYLLAFNGIFLVITISDLISSVFKRLLVVEFIASNTLFILGFHNLSFTIIKAFTVFVLKKPLVIFDHNTALGFLLSIVTIILLIPCIIIVNKYLPFITGKQPGRMKI
ncbi:acyltransferase family protein [Mucilaginibacter terrae]|uniref:Acyltransferase n=1 Tax=Mucilaginibacter terrae TaxID=1955052 RepID=A0ABU3GPE7_9SPHI|nr:acyltransferase family protein [Mucilaginibacter terrae]MDT3401641.1 acyltransferase [Mucilaginibacter terrae]